MGELKKERHDMKYFMIPESNNEIVDIVERSLRLIVGGYFTKCTKHGEGLIPTLHRVVADSRLNHLV